MRSDLCLFDLPTGTVESLLQTPRLIEAPNWSPCAGHLIVNAEGRLFRVALGDPRLQPVDTGGLNRLNNDHGISPDGKTLVFSDKTQTGEACIHTIPVTGGTARRITPQVPSYWHGWSPDGATLAYVARRDGLYDIRTCPARGGPEICLTRGFDHADGPDYTPDGQWIWFNGLRDGQMNLWRMHPDGSALERMSAGDRVDWFPHPSPCGAHVLYLSYAPGTRNHPRNREVQLRLMPAKGGAPRVLLDMFGGQGTINVPCWAPCGTRFAFVRYGRAT
ncbi:TolB family protein [Oceaniglobus trochenteri]|uniref:TolB family protein n=1 Tax=Oceaniglobus trochenteri TaxID=2763260 RepID=UPI001CFFA64E|nr:hypothetical protein [Oceaniglobus trochenteri]